MTRKHFGTDGIRGTVGEFPITPDFLLKLGNAVGWVLKRHVKGAKPQVLIGKDTRISGYMIESALQAGLISAGCDVALTGPLPTPGIAYLTRAMRLDMGIVISASHNPFHDNGVKFFSADGTKFSDEWEQEVEDLMSIDNVLEPRYVDSANLGKAIRIDDANGRYIEFCKSTFDLKYSLKGLRVVVDAAHGAAYHTAKSVMHELGAEVICVACDPNGMNINDGVGATHPEYVVEQVQKHGADYGIALDGDADRLQLVDNMGRLYDGDELLYLIACDRLAAGEKVPGVVGTVMTNMAIEVAFKELGVQFIRAKVGDRYVFEELEKRGWHLGGESSGHLLDLSKHTTGDGTISALLVFQALARRKHSVQQLLSNIVLYPQKMVNVRLPRKGYVWETQALKNLVHAIAENLQGRGRVLIRTSGTEPVIRVMVEAQERAKVEEFSKALVTLIKDEIELA